MSHCFSGSFFLWRNMHRSFRHFPSCTTSINRQENQFWREQTEVEGSSRWSVRIHITGTLCSFQTTGHFLLTIPNYMTPQLSLFIKTTWHHKVTALGTLYWNDWSTWHHHKSRYAPPIQQLSETLDSRSDMINLVKYAETRNSPHPFKQNKSYNINQAPNFPKISQNLRHPLYILKEMPELLVLVGKPRLYRQKLEENYNELCVGKHRLYRQKLQEYRITVPCW